MALAEWTGDPLVTIRGGSHAPTLRDPVQVNLLIRDFAERLRPAPPTRLRNVPDGFSILD